MITIQSYQKVNDVELNMDYPAVIKKLGNPDNKLTEPNGIQRLFWGEMEVEFQHSNIRSIAFNDVGKYIIDGKAVSLLDTNNLKSENPYYYDNTYFFPKWGIMVYNVDDYQNGFEVRFFSSSFKDEFSKSSVTATQYTDTLEKPDDPHPLFIIKPYHAAGPLVFGMASQEVETLLGTPLDTITIRGELREKRKNINTVYNAAGKLIQVSFENFDGVFYEGTDISSKGNLSPLFKDKEAFINRSYTIYFDLGIGFQNFNGKGIKTIVVFDQEKVNFWKNLHMPLL